MFTENGEKILAASTDGSIRVFDTTKVTKSTVAEALLLHIPGEGARIESLCVSLKQVCERKQNSLVHTVLLNVAGEGARIESLCVSQNRCVKEEKKNSCIHCRPPSPSNHLPGDCARIELIRCVQKKSLLLTLSSSHPGRGYTHRVTPCFSERGL